MKTLLFLLALILPACVGDYEIRVCADVCGQRGVKSATWLDCKCHPYPGRCTK
jgi:hypothetical protein